MSTRTLLAVVAVLFLAAPVQAAVISVSSPDPGSTVADDGQCSLPEAITAANTNTASGTMQGECLAGDPDPAVDDIVLNGDVELTLVLDTASGATGLPPVTSAIAVKGGGHTIVRSNGTPNFRIFHISAGGSLTLQNLTISNGSLSHRGGGIYNLGVVTLKNSTLLGNSSRVGGGIYNFGGTVSLTNSRLSVNSASDGGGIFNYFGTLSLENSTVSGNSASFWGGGIVNSGLVSITPLTLTDSTVSGNSARTGGGIYNDSTLTLTNSTVSGNSALFWGGGIYNVGVVTLTNSTLSGNSAPDGGGIYSGGTLTFTNSIVAASTDANCDGSITDNGGNFADDASCGAGFAPITPGVDFDTTLADNGGPTPTHALLHGSPAIDAIPPEDCTYDDDGDPGTPEVPLTEDQRGVARPLTGDGAPPTGCDAGAYEVTQCADGLHNDADGRIDFDGGVTAGLPPEEQTEPDLQCFGPTDTREKSRCGLGYELVLVLAVLLGRRHVAAQATVTSR